MSLKLLLKGKKSGTDGEASSCCQASVTVFMPLSDLVPRVLSVPVSEELVRVGQEKQGERFQKSHVSLASLYQLLGLVE